MLLFKFRGIKIIYQYCIDGRKIKNRDEARLHGELGLSYLKCRMINKKNKKSSNYFKSTCGCAIIRKK